MNHGRSLSHHPTPSIHSKRDPTKNKKNPNKQFHHTKKTKGAALSACEKKKIEKQLLI
jgi:hypothetical protein